MAFLCSSWQSLTSIVGRTSSWLTNARRIYAVPFKYFEDFSAGDALAVAHEVADVGQGCFYGVLNKSSLLVVSDRCALCGM